MYTNQWTVTGAGSIYDGELFFSPNTPVPPQPGVGGKEGGGFQNGTSVVNLNTPIPIKNTFTLYSSVSSGGALTVRVKYANGADSTFTRNSGASLQTYVVTDKAVIQ